MMASFSDEDEDRLSINSLTCPVKSRSVCDASAANLLMQVRRIALDEVISENHRETSSLHDVIPLTTLGSPPHPISTPQDSISLQKRKESEEEARNADKASCFQGRSRTISVESPISIELNKPLSLFTPVRDKKKKTFEPRSRSHDDERMDVPTLACTSTCRTIPSFLVSPETTKLYHKEETDDFSLNVVPSPPFNKKFVGHTLPEGVKVKDVLRPKYSWKSYPELEAYLIDHREQYLQYSNSLNYTKEQKRYNNRLTQGLLELAGNTGYVFEGFTFSSIRDRIRCFYKSFVQANKKKKQTMQQLSRSRSVTF